MRGAILVLVAAGLRAQSVDGTLVNSLSRTPIPDTIVTLLGPARYNGTTDELGAFHIDGVKPGKYMLNIVKAGYVLPPARAGAFTVEGDTRMAIEMDPLGVVEGRVRYVDGRPAPRATVWLGAPNATARSMTADIGGHFLFDDVKPGRYLLRALAAKGDPRAEGEIWAVTFFPSTTDASGAEQIAVVTGITETYEIRLRSVAARHIRGVVRDETGRPAIGATVSLRGNAGEEQTAQTGEDGRFDFLGSEGAGSLSVLRKDGEVLSRGFASVTASRHDVENAEVRMAVPFRVRVEFDRDDPPGQSTRAFPFMVWLTRVDGPTVVMPSSAEALNGVYPGRYRIRVMNSRPGIYVESIRYGEVEVSTREVEIADGSLPIRVAYRRGAPVLRGTVDPGEGATVVVVNADESAGDPVRMTKAGRGGGFEFSSLQPGDYYVLALDRDNVESGSAKFRGLLGRGEKVHLEQGGSVMVRLKVIAWE